jgi:hypothetical protein
MLSSLKFQYPYSMKTELLLLLLEIPVGDHGASPFGGSTYDVITDHRTRISAIKSMAWLSDCGARASEWMRVFVFRVDGRETIESF